MFLSFERVLDCGYGQCPQAVHDKSNLLRVIYLTSENTVSYVEANPVLGMYDNLSFEEFGRCSPDENISFPSLKRVAHYGAYGFWSAEGDHRFVIYMMPTDISRALVDGSIEFSVGNYISSMSCSLLNLRGELLNRYRALVTPGTKLEVYFALGNSPETPMGVFYIDRSSVAYPEEKVSIDGRNAIGKLLKEQNFDEYTVWDSGTLQMNIKDILEFAGVERYFVGDPGINRTLEFEPSTTLLEGIRYSLSFLHNWQVAETMDGVVGVAEAGDPRFDQPGVYTFVRDKTCWEYSIEYDDSNAASRVCVWSKIAGGGGSNAKRYVYVDVKYNRWWVQPAHRTLYVQTVDNATEAQMTDIANTIADSLELSGRVETFAGLFMPQLTLGDEVRVVDEKGGTELVGTLTDITHNFGRSGFFTSFTVDSGGRRSKTRLKDLITAASENPGAFTGIEE